MMHILWFQHKFKTISVQHGKAKCYNVLTNILLGENIPATLILRKCKCGKIKTELIQGIHSLTDISS
jgi:hypothetical protein